MTSPTYSFGASAATIHQIRSVNTDSLWPVNTLQVFDDHANLYHDWGTLSGGYVGDYGVGGTISLQTPAFTNIFVPDGGTAKYAFLLLNRSYDAGAVAELEAAMGQVVQWMVKAAFNTVGLGWIMSLPGISVLVNMFNPDLCDGVVAGGTFEWSSEQLLNMTTNPNKLDAFTVNYPGLPSPEGCGRNSNYDIQYVVSQYHAKGKDKEKDKDHKELAKDIKDAKDHPRAPSGELIEHPEGGLLDF